MNLSPNQRKQQKTLPSTNVERRLHRRRRLFDRYLVDSAENEGAFLTTENIRFPCQIIDIALKNCSIRAQHPWNFGKDIRLELKVFGNIIEIDGAIKTTSANEDGTNRYGIHFNDHIPVPVNFLQKKSIKSRRQPVDIYGSAKKFSKRLIEWKKNEHYHYHRKDIDKNRKKFIDFNSNDYLALRENDQIKKAAQNALMLHGLGTAGPSIFAGNYGLHDELAKRLASIKQMESCLLSPSGFSANSGIFTGLITIPNTLIFLDEKDHASIFHGALASKGKIKMFRHNDMDHLEKMVSQYEYAAPKVICVDGVYSMDGDLAPLDKIYEISKTYNASLWVDDAHSFGIFGDHGSGIESHFGLKGKIDIVTGSLSKALGGIGGFVCASKAVTDFLDHLGREFVYTTTLPAAICGGLIQGLSIIQNDCDQAREKLWENSRLMKRLLIEKEFPVGPTDSPIIPIIFGNETISQQFAQELYQMGIDINSVTRPAVRRNESRLRITVRTDHTAEQIKQTVQAMCKVRDKIKKV